MSARTECAERKSHTGYGLFSNMKMKFIEWPKA